MMKWNAITEEIKPEIGNRIFVDSWKSGWTTLVESDWDKAEFRAPTVYTDVELAVNIKITGHVHRWPFGVRSPRAVRIRLEFVGDDVPSTYASGWLITRDW